MPKAREVSPLRQPFGPRKIPRSIPIVLAAWAVGYVLAVIVPATNPFLRFAQDLAAPPLIMLPCALAGAAVLAWLKADWLGCSPGRAWGWAHWASRHSSLAWGAS